MTRDGAQPPPPPGAVFAVLAMFAFAVVGVLIIVAHTSVLNIVLGAVMGACGTFLGVVFLWAWLRARRTGS